MDRDERTALHIAFDRIERLARDSENARRHDAERMNNQTNLIRRIEDNNRLYYDALEEHRAALRKLNKRGKKLPPVPFFHAELVAQNKRDEDIPF